MTAWSTTLSHDDDNAAGQFPGALTGMGCPSTGCDGYELMTDLDFDSDGWIAGQSWIPIALGPRSLDGRTSFRDIFQVQRGL